MEDTLTLGSLVQIEGLQSPAWLNNRQGEVMQLMEDGRVLVLLTDPNNPVKERKERLRVAVSTDYLKPVTPQVESAQYSKMGPRELMRSEVPTPLTPLEPKRPLSTKAPHREREFWPDKRSRSQTTDPNAPQQGEESDEDQEKRQRSFGEGVAQTPEGQKPSSRKDTFLTEYFKHDRTHDRPREPPRTVYSDSFQQNIHEPPRAASLRSGSPFSSERSRDNYSAPGPRENFPASIRLGQAAQHQPLHTSHPTPDSRLSTPMTNETHTSPSPSPSPSLRPIIDDRPRNRWQSHRLPSSNAPSSNGPVYEQNAFSPRETQSVARQNYRRPHGPYSSTVDGSLAETPSTMGFTSPSLGPNYPQTPNYQPARSTVSSGAASAARRRRRRSDEFELQPGGGVAEKGPRSYTRSPKGQRHYRKTTWDQSQRKVASNNTRGMALLLSVPKDDHPNHHLYRGAASPERMLNTYLDKTPGGPNSTSSSKTSNASSRISLSNTTSSHWRHHEEHF